jgi:hypothetical protein
MLQKVKAKQSSKIKKKKKIKYLRAALTIWSSSLKSRMLSSEYNNNNNEDSEQESRVPVRKARVPPPHYKLDEPTQEQSTLSVESNYYVESSNPIIVLKIEQESNGS